MNGIIMFDFDIYLHSNFVHGLRKKVWMDILVKIDVCSKDVSTECYHDFEQKIFHKMDRILDPMKSVVKEESKENYPLNDLNDYEM